MLKGLLIFLAGVLIGANVVYFVMSRSPPTAPVQPTATMSSLPPVGPDATTAVPPSTADTAPAINSPSQAQAPSVAMPPPVTPMPSGLIVPVQGLVATQLTDTFSQSRSEGRVHEAIDIMATRGTPVLAASNGTVEKLFTSVPGGLTIYEFEPSGRYAYYYAHLDRYADGLVEGQSLQRGQVIGYVGSTGNASPDAPHLHFAVFALGPERQWWKGTAINPYPLLTTH